MGGEGKERKHRGLQPLLTLVMTNIHQFITQKCN
jgi:hypothetical protein